ncbi:MAG: DUF1648 domain-containing protein [Janthinobacterium lividum]
MENRPKLKLALTPADQLVEVLGWVTLLFLWGLVFYNYNNLPQIIPTHFNASGKANGFGNKSTLFLHSIIGTFLFVGLTALNKYPHIFNYPTAITAENALKQYTNATRMMRYIKLVVLLIFSAIVWMTTSVANGKSGGLSHWFLPVSLCLVFIPTVFFLFKSFRKT